MRRRLSVRASALGDRAGANGGSSRSRQARSAASIRMTRFTLCGRTQSRPRNPKFCRYFVRGVWATGLGHGPKIRVCVGNVKCLFAGTSKDGSDGTRTRDLRRDRPGQAPRRSTTNSSERPHLQAFLTRESPRHRMVELNVRSTFGPRVGHKIVPSETTSLKTKLMPEIVGEPGLRCAVTYGAIARLALSAQRAEHDQRRRAAVSPTRSSTASADIHSSSRVHARSTPSRAAASRSSVSRRRPVVRNFRRIQKYSSRSESVSWARRAGPSFEGGISARASAAAARSGSSPAPLRRSCALR